MRMVTFALLLDMVELVLDHYSKCATALKAIHFTGDLSSAIELLREKISKNQELSGWTLSLLGRCFFEMGRFKEVGKTMLFMPISEFSRHDIAVIIVL